MSKRPRQHRICDEAETQFAAILPSEWVFRREEKDYGIDGSVEIFDKDDTHTGLRFYVQLKGTDSKDSRYQRTIRFDETTLNYWHSQDLPTLLVRYCSEGRKIYFAWHFDRRITLSDDGKRASIKMTESDRWQETTQCFLRTSIEKITGLTKSRLSQKPVIRFEGLEDPAVRKVQRELRGPMKAYEKLVSFGDRRPEVIALEVTAEADGLLVSLEGVSSALVPVDGDPEKLGVQFWIW